ncbi:hypothetical protein H4K35_04760 [Myroides sp. NP-2]|uniref:hypothetical protein n=1 Tax=Myroides sp. NP-2 TaxID=2759945 RepID=UPI0015FD722D|nr:hypothetical protein [Myroides sp. NP-2]MBB1149452.1 hypothetical protein [Myroides sp. NP-2]
MRKVSLIVLIGIFFYNCDGRVKNNDSNQDKIYFDENRIVYDIDFPDTVYSKEDNYGLVSYKSHYDSIITDFGVKDTNRYARLIITTTNSIDYDYAYLKSIVKDTFGAYDNRSIYFMLKFENPGVFYIDGVINDLILIDLHKKNEEGIDQIRWLEDEVRVTKKVVVIDKE